MVRDWIREYLPTVAVKEVKGKIAVRCCETCYDLADEADGEDKDDGEDRADGEDGDHGGDGGDGDHGGDGGDGDHGGDGGDGDHGGDGADGDHGGDGGDGDDGEDEDDGEDRVDGEDGGDGDDGCQGDDHWISMLLESSPSPVSACSSPSPAAPQGGEDGVSPQGAEDGDSPRGADDDAGGSQFSMIPTTPITVSGIYVQMATPVRYFPRSNITHVEQGEDAWDQMFGDGPSSSSLDTVEHPLSLTELD